QCGNFAVLVDVHILPQGSSKDTSWFSDHEKEEVCMLLEEVVASRVKHYVEAPKKRGQWKSMEHVTSGPLFLTGKINYLTYCEMNFKHFSILMSVLNKENRGLRVFPDRLIVCVSKLESDPSAWTCENGVLQKEELSKGTSEYFTKFAENKKLKINLNEQIKQDILKEIVKMTKTKSSTSKPQISEDSKKVYLDSVDLQTGNRKNDCQASLSPQSEVKCSSTGLLKDWINTAEGNLEIPALELEIYVNQSQPDVSSQQKPCSAEWLKSSLISENVPCSSKSALLGPKQSQEVTKTQAQQKTYGSEEKLEHFQKVFSEEVPLTPSNTEMNKCCDDHLGPFLEKTLLNSRLFSKQDLMKTASEDESVTLGKNLSHPLCNRNNIEQTKKNEPSTTSGEFPVMPSSCLELQCVSSEK
ncbi:Protein SLX4IP, partial [Phalacrocorax carbo]